MSSLTLFFCLITGAKISKISLFDKEGGKVEHGSSKLPIIGQVFISLSPFFVGLLAIFFLSRGVGIEVGDITSVALTKDSVVNYFFDPISKLNLNSWQAVVVVYLVLSIAVTMAPSAQDFRNIALTLVLSGAVLYLIYRFTNFSFGESVEIPSQVTAILSTVAFLLILSLVLSIVVYVLSVAIKRK